MSMTREEYERWVVRQKQEAYAMEQQQIKGAIAGGNACQQKLKAQITAQQDALGDNICRLEAVIETLAHRLHPVLLDAPSVCRSEELVGGMSPVAAAFYEANQRVVRVADALQDLIERLEV